MKLDEIMEKIGDKIMNRKRIEPTGDCPIRLRPTSYHPKTSTLKTNYLKQCYNYIAIRIGLKEPEITGNAVPPRLRPTTRCEFDPERVKATMGYPDDPMGETYVKIYEILSGEKILNR